VPVYYAAVRLIFFTFLADNLHTGWSTGKHLRHFFCTLFSVMNTHGTNGRARSVTRPAVQKLKASKTGLKFELCCTARCMTCCPSTPRQVELLEFELQMRWCVHYICWRSTAQLHGAPSVMSNFADLGWGLRITSFFQRIWRLSGTSQEFPKGSRKILI